MLRASRFFLLALVALSAHAFAQETDVPWLSLKRLSVTAGVAYHYNPWKKYNKSMSLAQDAISYDSYYQNPSGHLEQILGDASYDLTLHYRILLGLSIGLRAGFLTTRTSSDVSYNPPFTSYAITSPARGRQTISQKIEINVPYYGMGLEYTYDLTDRVAISVSTQVSRYLGSLSFENRHDYAGISLWRELYTANLSERKSGVACLLDLVYRAHGSWSLVASVDYRFLGFAGLSGSGTYVTGDATSGQPSSYSHSFEARLGEADGYYGLIIRESDQPYLNIATLYTLWSRAPVQRVWRNQKPATLDLSAFGVSLGVRYDL
jgi:hypothetical protein